MNASVVLPANLPNIVMFDGREGPAKSTSQPLVLG
ncbi:MAG: hypothetical protein JWM91_3249 [Rhodospirillales bacterium]|nr:hypothetical protein [Rhodospirillales bacterium]